MRITKALADRVGDLPTPRLRLVQETLNARDPAEASDAELMVLGAATCELIDRGVDLCPDCAGLPTGPGGSEHVHTRWCSQTRREAA